MKKAVPYLDIGGPGGLPEDERIDLIGRTVIVYRKTVAILVDADPGKAGRYIEKLTERYPELEVRGQWPGPVAGVVTVSVGPKEKP